MVATHFTVSTFCILKNKEITLDELNIYNISCTKYSEKNGYEIKTVTEGDYKSMPAFDIFVLGENMP